MSISALSINMSLRRHLSTGATILALLAISACTQESVKTTTDESQPAEKIPTVVIGADDKEQYQTALTAMENGNIDKAESVFQDLTRSQPYMAGPYCNLALIQLKRSQYDESLKTIEKAITLSRNIPQAYNLRAQLYIHNGKIKEAETDYLKSLELDPNYANAHYNIALLYDIYYQDIQKAIQHYEKYMSLLDRPDKTTADWINHLKGSLKHG